MRSVKSNGVADILAASHKFGELQFRDRLLQNLFDPTASEMVYGFCDGIPSDITGDAFAFRAWLAQAAEILDDVFTSGNKQ